MNLKVYTSDGSSSSEKDYSGIVEFEGDKGLYALKQVILAYQANQRQGNASTKLRSEVSGTGKKPFRQKGTGGARQGSRRTVHFRGGGIVHGPKPRDYSQKVNKKVKRIAFQRAIFDRAEAGELDVIENLTVVETKTKLCNQIIKNIAPEGTVLLVEDQWTDSVLLSARNIERVSVTRASDLNAYDMCRYDRIIMSEQGIQKVLERATGGKAS